MADAIALDEDAAAARDWHHSLHSAVCDTLTPWEHGTVVRASRYPGYFDYNVVRVERDTQIGFAELAAVADRALDGLAHCRVDFDLAVTAERVRTDFEAHGWRATRLLWMRQRSPAPSPDGVLVQAVDYDAVQRLRVTWHREDFEITLGEQDSYSAQSRELALSRGARVLAVLEHDRPIAFTQSVTVGEAAEITHVYVDPEHRGRGLGTAITCAAIAAARGARDLWICADDEDRPKELYARLGFAPARTLTELLRVARRARSAPARPQTRNGAVASATTARLLVGAASTHVRPERTSVTTESPDVLNTCIATPYATTVLVLAGSATGLPENTV
ncbi:MAG TPA: GNAT family N-acetyltransferase [Solirubrobacteraceae bacterium]|nr:GNAT family N-acetyltransferase [Solirubrobacteraceae bacterium]